MSAIRALDELRGWLRDGNQGAAIVHSGGDAAASDVRAFVNDKADAIEHEHNQLIAELDGAICERDGRIHSYERRNTELADALGAICKRFGVDAKWSAEDAAKKVLDAVDSGYVELPRDAEGMPVKPGDELWAKDTGERIDGVHVYGVSSKHVYIFQEGPNKAHGIFGNYANGYLHHKPRTLENVLADVRDGNLDTGDAADEIRELMS